MMPGLCGPIVLPLEIIPPPDEAIPVGDDILDDAVALWNDASPLPLFVRVAAPSAALGWITVEQSSMDLWPEVEEGSAGAAWVTPNEGGEVVICIVRVDPLFAYTPEVYTRTVAHELGHCLGLADDPESLDLGSIMGDPPHWGARPTEHDLDLVLHGGCDG